MRAYYSWRVQNPNEALHDVKVDVSDGGSKRVHIGWDDDAERNSRQIFVAGDDNETTLESPLYGAVVGVNRGENRFTLSYVEGAAVSHHAAALLLPSLLAASIVFLPSSYF